MTAVEQARADLARADARYKRALHRALRGDLTTRLAYVETDLLTMIGQRVEYCAERLAALTVSAD